MLVKESLHNFNKTGDIKSSLDIGIKDYHDYIRVKSEEAGLDPDEFIDDYCHLVSSVNESYTLVETILSILENTPLAYQIDHIEDDLNMWIEGGGKFE